MRSILQLKRVQTEKANKSLPTNSSQGAKRNLTVDFRNLGEMGFRVLNFCIQDSPRRAHSIAAQGA